ncbi:hypothetical protein JS531_03750 [Bifidobacterium sp. CP2]|uniref:hypothetical protein n=1 Tax=Bifidobacterium TaxID=1678 RepID=UPI001BDD4420|nr:MULTISPECIES: hypothetical protein [Bifidobacterium]MBT1181097.1 hypothetical protein [Bifidobacterium sp. CP2]MBW3081108.1 hypothetical protein [Bifidobacterium saguinibicoloris]
MSRLMERVDRLDRLAERLTRIHMDWLLYLIWFAVWLIPGTMQDAPPNLPQRLMLVLYIPFFPMMTFVCWRCMRTRNLKVRHWRYPGGVFSMWMLTVLMEGVAISTLMR